MLHQFAIDRDAKALLIDHRPATRTVKSCESNSECFRTIGRDFGTYFYMVRNDVIVDDHLYTMRPRDEDCLTVHLGDEFERNNKLHVITLSAFIYRTSKTSLKFKTWFTKYAHENHIKSGVFGAMPPLEGSHLYRTIYYTGKARQLQKENVLWKQFEDDNVVFFPNESSY